MVTLTPLKVSALLLTGALLTCPLGAYAGPFDRHGGGGGGSGRGGGGGFRQGALIGALVGGVASVVSGGSFKEGAKAGAGAAEGGLRQAAQAGRNAARQSNQDRQNPNPFAGQAKPAHGEKPKTPEVSAPPSGPAAQQAAVAQASLTAAQAAALAAAPVKGLPPATLPPAATDGNPGADEDDPRYTDQQVQDHLRQQGKADFAKPGSGTPAPPMPMAGLDAPKRYQVDVPPVPPGVEVKGGQSAAYAQNAALKLNADAVNSTFGTTVDLQVIKAPSPLERAVGRRASGEVGGGRVDSRDGERALRAALSAGQSRFGLKDYNGALAEAEAAIELAPRDPQGYLLYARTLNKLGLHAKAEEMALNARKLSVTAEAQALAQSEVTQALLYRNRVTDALASATETDRLARHAGSKGLEANAQFLMAAACQLKGDRDCMVKSLERAAYLDSKYYDALAAAKAGRNIFDPNDKESLGLLDSVGGDVPLPQGLGAVVGGLLAVLAALAGAAGLAWRRSRRQAAKDALASAFGAKKDDGLLGGKYALGKPVALEGGGEAWEAEDVSLGRRAVVVRVATPAAAEEARRLASVHHPNVVDVFEVLDTDKGQFVVRERLTGRTLRQLLAGRGKMNVSEARRLLAPVCEALEAARGQSVVNGGLSLSSVMLCDEGYVKVVDLASHPSRGDVQALAACLSELLTGRPHRPDVPIAGASLELAALLSEAASGKVPGPAAFAARLERLDEAVLAG